MLLSSVPHVPIHDGAGGPRLVYYNPHSARVSTAGIFTIACLAGVAAVSLFKGLSAEELLGCGVCNHHL